MTTIVDSDYQPTHQLLRARDWQDRPELRALCDWWTQTGGGVLALVGIGGAGKTATADRFLQVLPGGFNEFGSDIGKDTDCSVNAASKKTTPPSAAWPKNTVDTP